ncbi:MAG: hypothetical protein Q4C87_00970 [Actinomycetaceae bacterium]|nr:hypothetical protein [Actinomycetaceae bacterium]
MSNLTNAHLLTLVQRFPPKDEPIYGEGPTYFGELGEWDFPADYLALLRSYGEGRIWDYITLLSPFSPSPYRNSFTRREFNLELGRQSDSWTRGMPERIASYGDLYPWADSDDADTFFWMWTNKEAGEYVVVLHNPKTSTWEIHDLTITEFLYHLWGGTLESKEYYPGFLSGPNYFISARTYDTVENTPPYDGSVETRSQQSDSASDFLPQLTALCPPPPTPILYDQRIRFSEFCPHIVPADYMELVNTYGDGSFNKVISLHSPYCLTGERNYFAVNHLRVDTTEDETDSAAAPYKLTDLHLWAESDNDDFFYWTWTNEAAGEYAIVVYNPTEEHPWEAYHLAFAEFLHQLLSGTLETEMVSLVCIDGKPSFTPRYGIDYFLLTRSPLDALIAVCPPPNTPVTYGELMRFNEFSDLVLPEDYIEVARTYGEGRFNDSFSLSTPFSVFLGSNVFHKQKYLQEEYREHPLWLENTPPEIGDYADLYVWAKSGYRDNFMWMWTDQPGGDYVIVVHNIEKRQWEFHHLTFAEFLARVTTRTLNTHMSHFKRISQPARFEAPTKNDAHLTLEHDRQAYEPYQPDYTQDTVPTPDKALDALTALCPPPASPYSGDNRFWFNYDGNWDFPADYLALLSRYGIGRFCDYMNIYSPYIRYPAWNCHVQKRNFTELSRENFFWNSNMPEDIASYADLYPWGQSDIGVMYYWRWINKDKGTYQTILHAGKGSQWEVYDMTITEVLYHLLTDQLPTDFFPDDLLWDGATYNALHAPTETQE